MKFASLGSGSRGNGTVLQHGDSCVLIDCGFTVKETERRLARLGLAAEDLDAILVTHEHSDHIGGVAPLARKHRLPVYMTPGTWRAKDLGELPDLCLFDSHATFRVAGFAVEPVPVPHDAREPTQFVFTAAGRSFGVLTDLGSLTPHVCAQYAACDALVLEANHDLDLLANGPYPLPLKQRVGGNWGHLNNQQAAALLRSLDVPRLQHLVVGHISQHNNRLDLAQAALAEASAGAANVIYASQDEGFDWLSLA